MLGAGAQAPCMATEQDRAPLSTEVSPQRHLELRRMKKVAVFGNAAGGKSTLARRLAELTRLPVYPLDTIQYRHGGGKVPHEEYLKAHADLLMRDQWIIDGFGCVPSAWERFAAADTLVYIDLPLFTHYRWVTKRLVKGFFVNPEGWPETVLFGAARWTATVWSGSAIAI